MDLMPCTYDEHSKTWKGGKKEPYYHPDVSLGKIIFTTMKNYPKNVCQISDTNGKVLTNEEALTWAIRIAQRFKKMGLKHDDVIGIAAKNTTYLVAVAVACFMNCTPFHAVNPILDEATLKHMFGLTKPKVIFCDGSVYEKVYSSTHLLKPIIYTMDDHIEGVSKVEDLLEPTNTEMFYRPENLVLGGDQTVAILCSSGTTGLPKAVCVSSYNVVDDTTFTTAEDVIYNSSGLDWMTGLFFLVLQTALGCTRIITNKPYSPEYFVELVKKYKITSTIIAPRHAATLVTCPTATRENLKSIRFLTLAGGSISKTTLQKFHDILGNVFIAFGYGLTESGGISSNFGMENCGSVGKIVPGVQVRIVDDNGKNLGPNEEGEILTYNGRKWNGYYGNPVGTQRMQDSLGWFHTGDVGYFDEKNFLYVVDRKKEILKYQGMHYWPAEIENAIAEMPQVIDVSVVGIYDERNGDAAAAAIVKREGAALTVEEVKDHVAKRLPVPYKQLHGGVLFVEKIPQNANGKTDKRKTKALFGEAFNQGPKLNGLSKK